MIYLKRFAALVSLLLVGVILFSIATYCYRGELSHTRSNISGFYAEERDSIDVIIMGTSCTFSSYMPMETWNEYGIVSYNFCTNVLLQNSMKYYVRELQKTQSPQLLIIDTASFLYGHNSDTLSAEAVTIHRNTDALPMSINRINLINELLPTMSERFDYYFDLLYYKDAEPVYDYWTNKKHTVLKGYNNLPLHCTYMESDRIEISDSQERALPEQEEAYLQELFAELRTFEGDVLFISQPVFPDEAMLGEMERERYISKVIVDNGFDYLNMADYSEEIGIDGVFDYSLDEIHYNSMSAQKITRFLAGYIVDTYNIPDRREDAKYASWHEDYNVWKEILAEEEAKTHDERDEYLYKQTSIGEYLKYLQSTYYNIEIFIPSNSQIWNDSEVLAALSEINQDISGYESVDCYLTKEKLVTEDMEEWDVLNKELVSSREIKIVVYDLGGENIDSVQWCYDESENSFLPARIAKTEEE